jgi:hypothetical protein
MGWDDERWFNDYARDKHYGETYSEARIRKREEFLEGQRLDRIEKLEQDRARNAERLNRNYPIKGYGESEKMRPETPVGVILVVFSLCIWGGLIPLAEVMILGYSLPAISLGSGILVLLFRDIPILIGAGLLILGGGLTAVFALMVLISPATLADFEGNFFMSISAGVLGAIILWVIGKKFRGLIPGWMKRG